MSTLTLYLKSSIGRKWIMALTGLGLAGFVLIHMLGNLLIFVGPDAYNAYGHSITSNPLYKAGIMSGGLVALAVIHAFTAAWLTKDNMSARTRYAMTPNGDKAASLASRTMAFSGTIILVFLISHLATFKYGAVYDTTVNGTAMRDLHRLIVEVFQQPGYVAWYVVSLILLYFHLSHGFSSTFKTLGLSNPKYIRLFDCISVIYAALVAAGFLSQPIYVYFFHN